MLHDVNEPQELLARVIERRDARAFEVLVHAHRDAVFDLALRIVRDAAAAEDVSQDVFVTLYTKAGTKPPSVPLRPWLLRITYNAAMQVLRSDRRRERREQSYAMQENPSQTGSKIERAELQAALASLPDEMQVPLTLRYLNQLQPAEIAQTLDIPVGTVGSRIARGLQRLREMLGEGSAAAPAVLALPALEAALTNLPLTSAPSGVGSIIAIQKLAAAGSGKAVGGSIAMKVGGMVAATVLIGATFTLMHGGTPKDENFKGPDAPPKASSIKPVVDSSDTPCFDLTRALNARLDVCYRQDSVNDVINDLVARVYPLMTLYRSGSTPFVVMPDLTHFRFSMERRQATVKDVIEKLAGDAQLTVEYWRYGIILWKASDGKTFAEIEAMLKSPDINVRCDAAAKLGRLGDKKALPLLLKAIAEGDDAVAYWATRAPLFRYWQYIQTGCRIWSGVTADKNTVAAAIQRIRSAEYCRQLSQGAVQLWAAAGKDGIERLLELLKDKDLITQYEAARALGGMRAQEAVAPLKALVAQARETHAEPRQRWAIWDALASIGGKDATAALSEIMAAGGAERREILSSIASYPDPASADLLLKVLKDPKLSLTPPEGVFKQPTEYEILIQALYRLGQDGLRPALDAELHHPDAAKRDLAIATLARCGDDAALDLVASRTKDFSDAEKYSDLLYAMEALAPSQPKAAELRKNLSVPRAGTDDQGSVHNGARRSDPAATERWAELMASGANLAQPYPHGMCLRFAPAAMKKMLPLARSENDWIRNFACQMLGESRMPDAADALAAAAADEKISAENRSLILLALANTRQPEALEALLRIAPAVNAGETKDLSWLSEYFPDDPTLMKAIDADPIASASRKVKVGDYSAAMALAGAPDIAARKRLAKIASAITNYTAEYDPQTVTLLMKLMQDPSAEVRAVVANSQFGVDPRLKEQMLQCAKDENASMRLAVARSLRTFRSQPEVLASLLELSKDTDGKVRSEAGVALCMSNSDEAYARVIEMLKDADNAVRWAMMTQFQPHDIKGVDAIIALLNEDGNIGAIAKGKLQQYSQTLPKDDPLIARINTALKPPASVAAPAGDF